MALSTRSSATGTLCRGGRRTPPTALAPFAAATLTRADPYITTLQSWKYALPAFLVPFIFVLDPIGIGLLLEVPKNMSWAWVPWVTLGAAGGIEAVFTALAIAGLGGEAELAAGVEDPLPGDGAAGGQQSGLWPVCRAWIYLAVRAVSECEGR